MAVGDSALIKGLSYLGVGRETTFGTFNTLLSGLDFISHSIKTQKDSKILDQVERSRTLSKRIQLSKQVGGEVSWYLRPMQTADCFLIHNAFGGALITSTTVTAETVGGGGMDHVVTTGNFDLTYSSLCMNARKGGSTGGIIWQYHGIRTEELTISAAIDEPVMCAASIVCRDSTQVTSNIETQLTTTSNPILSFVDGRVSVETTFASLTTSSIWNVQSVEFKVKNNLKTGAESRRIGTDILTVLPPGLQTYELSMNIRFDTTTAWSAMINATRLAAELEFLGPTITGSVARQGLLLEFQEIYVKDAGDPEVSGPDGILTSQVTFDVMRDESASGYAVRATVTNNIANFT